jgi:hypothetical protein
MNNFGSIQLYFNLATSIIFTFVGFVGNGLVIYVISRPKFRIIPMFRYMIIAMIIDSFNVLTAWPSIFPYAFKTNRIVFICKFFYYLVYVFYQFSPWVIVISTLDRYLSVKYENRFKFRKDFKYQAIAVLIIFLVLVLIDFPFYHFYSLDSNMTLCTADFSIGFYLNCLDLLIATVIPFILMMSLNSLTAYQLIHRKKRLQKNKKKFKKEIQYFKTTLALCLYFLFLNLPFCILTVVCNSMNIQYLNTLIFYICNALTYFYSSFNCFIYFLFNKRIRHHFLLLIGYRRKSKKVVLSPIETLCKRVIFIQEEYEITNI